MTHSTSTPPQPEAPGERGVNLRGLILLNLALLLVLAGVTFAPFATAQQPSRARGEYTMVGGRAQGTDSAVIYIVDAINQEMVAITYSNSQQTIEGVGYVHLGRDSAEALRGNMPTR